MANPYTNRDHPPDNSGDWIWINNGDKNSNPQWVKQRPSWGWDFIDFIEESWHDLIHGPDDSSSQDFVKKAEVEDEFRGFPLRPMGTSPFALREANRTPVERIRLKHQQEKGLGANEALKEQNDFNYSAISDPPLAKADFRRGYFEQWSRFHKFNVQSIAARLFDPIDEEAKLELRKIYTDQYSRWKKLDPVAAINWRKLKSRNELLITDNQPLDLPDGKTIATTLNKHIFDPLRQAGIDPSTTVPIEAQAQLRFFNETGLTRQPGMLRIIGR